MTCIADTAGLHNHIHNHEGIPVELFVESPSEHSVRYPQTDSASFRLGPTACVRTRWCFRKATTPSKTDHFVVSTHKTLRSVLLDDLYASSLLSEVIRGPASIQVLLRLRYGVRQPQWRPTLICVPRFARFSTIVHDNIEKPISSFDCLQLPGLPG